MLAETQVQNPLLIADNATNFTRQASMSEQLDLVRHIISMDYLDHLNVFLVDAFCNTDV